MDERHYLVQRKLKAVDRKLREAVRIAEGVAWKRNPEVVVLLAHAIDEVRRVVWQLDGIMAAQAFDGD
jgi:hypothetical protein